MSTCQCNKHLSWPLVYLSSHNDKGANHLPNVFTGVVTLNVVMPCLTIHNSSIGHSTTLLTYKSLLAKQAQPRMPDMLLVLQLFRHVCYAATCLLCRQVAVFTAALSDTTVLSLVVKQHCNTVVHIIAPHWCTAVPHMFNSSHENYLCCEDNGSTEGDTELVSFAASSCEHWTCHVRAKICYFINSANLLHYPGLHLLPW